MGLVNLITIHKHLVAKEPLKIENLDSNKILTFKYH